MNKDIMNSPETIKNKRARTFRALAAGSALMIAASGCAKDKSNETTFAANRNTPSVEVEQPTTTTAAVLPEQSTTTTQGTVVENEGGGNGSGSAESIVVQCDNGTVDGKFVVNEDGSWTHYGPDGEKWGDSSMAPNQANPGLSQEGAEEYFCTPNDV